MTIKNLFIFLCFGLTGLLSAQTTTLSGTITDGKAPLPFASFYVKNTQIATLSDENGKYQLKVPTGTIILIAEAQGYRTQELTLTLTEASKEINFVLPEDVLGLEEIVVSATRNRVERKNAPVIVSSIKPRLLTATQSISVAEGLNFTSGVRVETNCQNCGFTQVRLNGLSGGYTQILLNSRPIFTSLLGVYGLEQIPTNIVERIEVVRGGGSALYGSSAIAGTVNIITKDPILNTWETASNLAVIDGQAWDRVLNFNGSMVADDLNKGVTIFGAYRNRQPYDANGDGFTEIVELSNTTLGAKGFIRLNDRSRISANATAIKEFRRGGDRLDLAPQFTDITEQLDHNTILAGADYEIDSKDRSLKTQLYTSGSYTDRASFYGGLGGGRTRQDSILASNAFGTTQDFALVNGVQLTKTLKNRDILTVGSEYTLNSTEDIIPAYNRLIDQKVNGIGAYGQYEWKPTESFTALLGGRIDRVSVNGNYTVGEISREVDITQNAVSPRLTLSYKLNNNFRLRGGYARGFRAPQAFNEDLHIASVGGEQQFVILSDNLQTEYSNAFTGSLNFSKSKNLMQIDALVEGFYTTLEDPFTLVSTGASLANGSIVEEVRNGNGAMVYGSNFEVGVSPNSKWVFQLGGTLQRTQYNESQLLFESDGTVGESNILIDEFVRVPNLYGYLNTTWVPNKTFTVDLTGTYTGNMTAPRVISETGFLELNPTGVFVDMNLKVEAHFDFNQSFMITVLGGVTNIFNSYQDDFDIGATRDSDYVYGPDAPRGVFFGLKFGKFH